MATDVPWQRALPRYASLPSPYLALSGLAATAGVIHVVAAIDHVGADWMLGVFFVLVGAAQLLVAWWIYRKPEDEQTLKAAALGSVVVALLWIFSRTTGLPFGPDAGEVSSVGVADSIATFQELLFAALVVAIVWRPDQNDRRLSWLSGRLVRMSSMLGMRFTSAFLSTALFVAALGGHEH